MTPKEKAEELVSRFSNIENVKITYQMSAFSRIEEHPLNEYEAKQCALIAVDEILNVQSQTTRILSDTYMYWREVKQEIEKL